ncbi:MAG: hypothetical protein RBR74_03515 [Ignavibacteriaceae bacterium]|jgi:hypothetical protein|nr:hypothetical protein [Ignavibacteriaceae bacterium]
MENQIVKNCLSCNRTENEIPLVSLNYSSKQTYICSYCLPLLIHHPEQLIGKLKGADKIPPAQHND